VPKQVWQGMDLSAMPLVYFMDRSNGKRERFVRWLQRKLTDVSQQNTWLCVAIREHSLLESEKLCGNTTHMTVNFWAIHTRKVQYGLQMLAKAYSKI
jgi:hypothetical protein